MSEGTADKLAIYKSQANAASKKKEKAQGELQKLEEDLRSAEKSLDLKEKAYAQAKGTKFMKHDDFKQYASTLRGKQGQYKRMRNEIQEIKAELTVLMNTDKILKSKSDEIIVKLKAIEIETGAFGIFEAEEGLNAISVKHEEINTVKTLTLAQLSEKSSELKRLIDSRKSQLDPLLKELRALKDKYQEVESRYNEQRQQYDSTVFKLDNEKAGLVSEAEKLGVRSRRTTM